jgi:hypothetical protein
MYTSDRIYKPSIPLATPVKNYTDEKPKIGQKLRKIE